MSHIPNSAMPHAGPSAETSGRLNGEATAEGRFGALREKARDYPKTAVAAGAAVAAGLVAAAAIPAIRSRKRGSEK